MKKQEKSKNKRHNHQSRIYLIFSLILFVTLIGLYFVWPDYQEFLNKAWQTLSSGDQQKIKSWVSTFGAWGPLLIIFLMVLQMFLIVAPSWLIMVIAILAYGPVKGCILSIMAVSVASSIGYGIGRFVGENGILKLIGESKEQAVVRETNRYGLWAIVIARINPLLSNDAVSFLAGMLRMGYLKFLSATVVGIAPLAIAMAAMGENWKSMKSGFIWLSAISLIGLGVKIWFDKKKGG